MLLRVSIAKAGEDVSRVPEFSKPEVTIGRRPTNDVILPDDGVSGQHAKVLITGNTLTLVDQGSTNGTFLGGERLDGPRAVSERDEVLISDYRLTFSLVDSPAVEEAAVRTPVAPSGTAEVPLSEALGWSSEEDLPPPPPMLDDEAPAPDPIPVARRPEAPTSAKPVAPTSAAARVPPPPVPSAGPSAPASAPGAAFDFDPQSPRSLHEQVFAAVWSRVSRDVVAPRPGLVTRVGGLLDQAIASATRVGSLGTGARAQIAQEILTNRSMEVLLKGEPDEVLVRGTQGVRVNRGGHVSVGPSPLSCSWAAVALASRLCGVVLDRARPVVRQTYGKYSVVAVHESRASGVTTLSLRKTPSLPPATIEDLEAASAIASIQSHILRSAVRAGLQIVICVGPGTDGRSVLAALLSAATSNELQVVVAPMGADARCLRAGTVLLNRDPAPSMDAVITGLRLGPTRMGLEDIGWAEHSALDALVSSSVRVIASLRARSPQVALRRLAAMLDGTQGSRGSAAAFVASSVDLFVTVAASRDGAPRIVGLAEPLVAASGEVELKELAIFDPQSQTWSAALGSSPGLDDLVHRGQLDPRVLQPTPTPEPT